MSARSNDPVFARAAAEHPTMSGLAGGGVRSDPGDIQRRLNDLANEARAAGLDGVAGYIRLTVGSLRVERGREEAIAELCGLAADDRARAATRACGPDAADLYTKRAEFYERAVEILRKTATVAAEPAEDICPVGTTLGGES